MFNKDAFKQWSTWLSTVGTLALGFFLMLPDQALTVWNLLPDELKATMPKATGLQISLGLLAASILAKFVRQKAVTDFLKAKLGAFVAWARFMGIAGAVTAKKASAGAAGALVLALTIIAPWEGKANDPYYDIVGVKTVCYGETQGVQDRHYSDAECSAMLRTAVEIRFLKPVIDCVPQIADRPRVLAASTSLAYNIGTTAFCGSTAARRLRAGDLRGGCEAFMMWTRAGGKVRQGLINRRMAERKVCLAGVT